MVRESGSCSGSMSAISVLRERITPSAPNPTTQTVSPGDRSRTPSFADRTGVVPMSFGS